jgi:hypothetical protein
MRLDRLDVHGRFRLNVHVRKAFKRRYEMATTKANATTNLEHGALVVSKLDGEPGRVVEVNTFRRNGTAAWSYLVQTANGQEVWHAGDLFVPAAAAAPAPGQA